MKKILIILSATLFITLTAKGQNLFFIGENSYPCTETISLQSNYSDLDDLKVVVAKDQTKVLFGVSVGTKTEALFGKKLIIFLDDGTVITCIERVKHDYVDENALAVYSLTNEQLSKMKRSNINTVRYALKFDMLVEKRDFSASNKGKSTKTVITEFFDE